MQSTLQTSFGVALYSHKPMLTHSYSNDCSTFMNRISIYHVTQSSHSVWNAFVANKECDDDRCVSVLPTQKRWSGGWLNDAREAVHIEQQQPEQVSGDTYGPRNCDILYAVLDAFLDRHMVDRTWSKLGCVAFTRATFLWRLRIAVYQFGRESFSVCVPHGYLPSKGFHLNKSLIRYLFMSCQMTASFWVLLTLPYFLGAVWNDLVKPTRRNDFISEWLENAAYWSGRLG